jgi:hypothetical protein
MNKSVLCDTFIKQNFHSKCWNNWFVRPGFFLKSDHPFLPLLFFDPDNAFELRNESLTCKKSAPFIRNSEQRYGYRRKGGEASDLKQVGLGIDFLMRFPGLIHGNDFRVNSKFSKLKGPTIFLKRFRINFAFKADGVTIFDSFPDSRRKFRNPQIGKNSLDRKEVQGNNVMIKWFALLEKRIHYGLN